MSYQVDGRSLAEIRRDIKDQIIAKLEEARAGALSAVASIAFGDRTDVGEVNQMPLIWVLPTPHQPELRGGHTAIHDFTFSFVVMVHELDATQGKDIADDLASIVYDVISADRTLNGMVFDIRPLNVDPSYEAVTSTNVYWSNVEFAFRIQRRE
jgi:hypothetical protein